MKLSIVNSADVLSSVDKIGTPEEIPAIPHLETQQYLFRIIKNGMGNKIEFAVQPGFGEVIIQRVRTLLSKTRSKLRRHDKPVRAFKLHAEVLRDPKLKTEAGVQFENVIFWCIDDSSNNMDLSDLELMVSGKDLPGEE